MENIFEEEINYGVNIKKHSKKDYERLKTFDDLSKANKYYKDLVAILKDTEIKFDLELEEIKLTDFDAYYKTIKSTEKWYKDIKDPRIDYIDDSIYDIDGELCVLLKPGYVASMGEGFFHCTTKEVFEKELSQVKYIKECTINELLKDEH